MSKLLNQNKMKKLLVLVSVATLFLGSCRDQEVEVRKTEVIREVQVEKVKTTDETPNNEGIFERAAKKVDKKVNDKIDEKIDNID